MTAANDLRREHPGLYRARSVAVAKGRAPSADRLRLEVLDEGDVVQVMHHGPYADEGPAIGPGRSRPAR